MTHLEALVVTEQAQRYPTRPTNARPTAQRVPDRAAPIISTAGVWDRAGHSHPGLTLPRAGRAATFTA